MAIISISNAKGGVGKSTTAICLATLLSNEGKVLLVDADANQSAVLWAVKGLLPFSVLAEKASRKAMAQGGWKHIILDSQAAPNAGEFTALSQGSDLLIVPTTPDGPALAATVGVFGELVGAQNAIALITAVPPKPMKDGVEAAEALTKAGIRQFDRQIRHGKAYRVAFERGCTLPSMGSYLRAGQLWRDWQVIGNELKAVLEEEP